MTNYNSKIKLTAAQKAEINANGFTDLKAGRSRYRVDMGGVVWLYVSGGVGYTPKGKVTL